MYRHKFFYVSLIIAVVLGTFFFATHQPSLKPSVAHAAGGGACPTAATYTNPSNPAGSLVTLASLGITNCYYVADNGSDSNSGMSESTPWLHAPMMPNCSSNCLAVQNGSNGTGGDGIPAGTGIIFRGGDTWNFGISTDTNCPGASCVPSSGGTWQWAPPNLSCPTGLCPNGTSAHPIYLGVDATWYTGSSWARPIFTANNPLCNAGNVNGTTCLSTTLFNQTTYYVSGCANQIGGVYNDNDFLDFGADENYIIDGFEMTGLCQSGYQQNRHDTYIWYGSTNGHFYFLNNYLHGSSHVEYWGPNGVCAVGTVNTAGTSVTLVSESNSGYGGECGDTRGFYSSWKFLIIGSTTYTIASVNSASSITLTTSAGNQTGASFQGGCIPASPAACLDIYAFQGGSQVGAAGGETVANNILDFMDSDWSNTTCFGGFYDVEYNVFRNTTGCLPGTLHAFHDNLYDYFYENGHSNVIESDDLTGTDVIYNNVFRHIETSTTEGGVFLWFGPSSGATDYIFNNVGYDVGNLEYLNNGGVALTTVEGNYVWFNNTWQSNGNQPILRCAGYTNGTIADNNNQYITEDSTYILGPCSTLTTTTPLLETNSTAASYGYTSSETFGYSPSSASSPTVGAGTNEQAYCTTLLGSSDPIVQAAGVACESDTTYACTYNASNHTVSCPNRTVVARPASAAWDIGAYQYSSSGGTPGTPSTPTGLAVTGSTTSTISLSWNASTEQGGSGSIVGYKVYRNSVQVGTTGSTSYTDSGLSASTTYSYAVSAYDTNGNTSSQSGSVQGSTKPVDNTPPSIAISYPQNNATVSSTITISGTASDNVQVASVAISIDGGSYQSAQGTTSWTYSWNTNGVSNGSHTITAKATDTSGNTATASVTVTVSNTSGGGGGSISRLGIDGKSGSCGDVVMKDTLATSTTSGELIFVEYSSGANGVDVPTISDSAGDTYTVIASSQQLNTHSRIGIAYLQDAPSGITWVGLESPDQNDQVCFMIEAHYSGIAVIGALDQATSSFANYQSSPWASGKITTTQASELMVGGSFDYNFSSQNNTPSFTGNWSAGVTQSDEDGNALILGQQIVSTIQTSASSTGTDGATNPRDYPWIASFKSSATSTDNTPPTVSITSPTNGATVSSTISVQASASDNVGVIEVQFYLDSILVSTDFSSPYIWSWNTASSTNGSHTLSAKAYDAAGNVGISSNVVVTVANQAQDTQPPSVPTGLMQTGATTSSIAISWNPSSDNVGVAGYKVYRNTNQVGNVNATSFADTGLTPSTTYSYTVSAYDAAGNQSASSSPLLASTLPLTNQTSSPSSTLPEIISFTANPGTINQGSPSTLSWLVTGNPAPVVSISTLGQVSGSSVQVTPSETTTYTLTAENSQGTTSTQATVTVNIPNNGGGGGGGGGGGSSGGGGGGGGSSGSGSGSGSGSSGSTGSSSSTNSGTSGSGSSGSSQQSLASLLASLLQEVEALITQLNTQLVATFTRNLTIGSSGQDVKNLQVFLNDNGYTIASTGAGSPGDESTYFGARTAAALAKFQAASQITPASGILGPKTRAYLEGEW